MLRILTSAVTALAVAGAAAYAQQSTAAAVYVGVFNLPPPEFWRQPAPSWAVCVRPVIQHRVSESRRRLPHLLRRHRRGAPSASPCYDWNGYQLLDTPGVNAPIKHEQATAEQLARINAIMLVVREGDQDAKDVYDRLFSMIRALSRSLV